jgi:hypothetical protein
MSTTKKEGRNTVLKNKLKRATNKAKKEYLHSICDEINEFQRTEHYNLMYKKMKELEWKDSHGIHSIGTEDSQGNTVVD